MFAALQEPAAAGSIELPSLESLAVPAPFTGTSLPTIRIGAAHPGSLSNFMSPVGAWGVRVTHPAGHSGLLRGADGPIRTRLKWLPSASTTAPEVGESHVWQH